MKTKYLYVAPFQTDIMIVHCTPDELLPYCKKKVDAFHIKSVEQNLTDFPICHTTNGLSFLLDGGGTLIWTRKGDRGTIIHELVHAINHMFREKSIPLSEDTDEVYAYLSEYIINSLI